MLTGIIRPVKAISCIECSLERIEEKSHNTPSHCKKYPLEYIHTNIADLFPIANYNSCQYWVTFLDNTIRLSTNILITIMSKMFDKLRKFLSMYKQPERCCHRIRFDNSRKTQAINFDNGVPTKKLR